MEKFELEISDEQLVRLIECIKRIGFTELPSTDNLIGNQVDSEQTIEKRG